MRSRKIEWLAAGLVILTGMIHLYMASAEYEEAHYMGYLFVANFVAAIVAAVGIRRGAVWGWVLGFWVAAGAIVGYVLSRTTGMPGMEVEEWLYPVGLLSLIVEGAFVALFLAVQPWARPRTEAQQRNRYLVPAAALLPVLLLGLSGLLGNALLGDPGTPHLSRARLVPASVLEEEYGVKVRQIGLSMMGSIVDFRLSVRDAEKAMKLFDDPGSMPMLLVGGSDAVLMAPGHHMRPQLKDGKDYYMFFPNPDNVVRQGTPVSVQFGHLLLAPISVQ